jgi:AcrR family transcriptional regulator
MGKRKPRDLHDPDDLWWTYQQAMDHLGITRRTLNRYFADKDKPLARYFLSLGGYVKREDILAIRRDRIQRDIDNRMKKSSA